MKNRFSLLYGAVAFVAVCLSQFCNAQTAQWCWMKGSNTVYQTGTYGTQGTAATANTPGARYGSVSWKDADGNMWLFGGYGYSSGGGGYLNDLWKLTVGTGNWAWVKGSSHETDQSSCVYNYPGDALPNSVPGGRYGSVTWTDNAGNLWLMGGYGFGYTTFGPLNDLWKYNIATNTWSWMKGSNEAERTGIYGSKGVAAAANMPGGRFGGAGWKDNSGNLWLFSGEGFGMSTDGSGLLNDLWKYNIATNQWAWMSGGVNLNEGGTYGNLSTEAATNQPGGRTLPTAWTDNSGNFWLWGGDGMTAADGRGYLNDLWKYNVSTGNWTWMKGSKMSYQSGSYGIIGTHYSGNTPGSRCGAVSWKDNAGNLWLMGGYGVDANGNIDNMNDLWRFDLSTGYWGWIKGSKTANQPGVYGSKGVADPANVPGGRYFYVSWTDNTGNFWLTGGYGKDQSSSGMLNDLWKFTPPATILPLTLTSFTAVKQNSVAQLSWTVAQEENIVSYSIEAGSNSRNFNPIGKVASLGNTSGSRTYNFTDFKPAQGANYYRLKITETDGKSSYSDIRLLNFGSVTTLSLYPNPAKDFITLTGLEPGTQLRIINVSGQIVLQQKAAAATETIRIAHLSAGTYQVQVLGTHAAPLNQSSFIKTP